MSQAELELFISPEGRDGWSGGLPVPNADATDGPVATLGAARDKLRALRAGAAGGGGVAVTIAPGVYELTEQLRLEVDDGGSPEAPVVWRAQEPGTVFIRGGRPIVGFTPVTDAAVLARIPVEAHGKVLVCDLAAQGIKDFGEMVTRGFGRGDEPSGLELFFDGEAMTLARWPNKGWTHIAEVPNGLEGGCFSAYNDRPSRWLNAPDVWVHGYWMHDWADNFVQVDHIDAATNTIYTREPHGVFGYRANQRWRALNLLEELDEPGEWYLDRADGLLYFWPPKSIAEGEAIVSLFGAPMIVLEAERDLRLEGLTIEYGRDCGIRINGGERCTIGGCTIRNMGAVGLIVGGGTGHLVTGCDFYGTGETATKLRGGDRRTLEPGGNAIVNCHIHHYGRWCPTLRVGVDIDGVGNRIANCLIEDGPHCAIILGGNEHLIELNEIRRVCLYVNDAGAFYLGRDWTERGNTVKHNFFHHVGPGDVQAIYLDDWSSGTIIIGNIIWRTGRGIMVGGGRDNYAANNIIVECYPAVHVDARGLGWASFYFDGSTPTLFDRLEKMNYKEPPYSERYPELLTLLEDEPAKPKGNVFERNVLCLGRPFDFHLEGLKWEDLFPLRDNFVSSDPGFVDREGGNFELREDSPAWRMGFERIPVEKIGLYRDEYRQTTDEEQGNAK